MFAAFYVFIKWLCRHKHPPFDKFVVILFYRISPVMSSFFLKKIMALARNEFHYQHQKLYNHKPAEENCAGIFMCRRRRRIFIFNVILVICWYFNELQVLCLNCNGHFLRSGYKTAKTFNFRGKYDILKSNIFWNAESGLIQ